MMGAMRRNLIAGLLIAIGLALMATALPASGLVRLGSPEVATQQIPALSDPLSPPHQHPKFLPNTNSTGAGPNLVVAYLSIPRLGIKNAPIFDRGVDTKGNMLIAKGYAVTHYAFSSPIGSVGDRLPRHGQAGHRPPHRGTDPAADQRCPAHPLHLLAQLGGHAARRRHGDARPGLVVRLLRRLLEVLQ
jgi:hypothetical protein